MTARLLAWTTFTAALLAGPVASFAQSAIAPATRPAAASPTSAGPAWNSLSNADRAALAPLERDWTSIEPDRKAKWLEIAAKFQKMPPDEQRRVQERMTEWTRLSPTERGRARMSFQEAKQLSPEKRQAQWQAYQALPDAERKALAARSAASAAKPAAPKPSVDSLAAVPKKTAPQLPPKPAQGQFTQPVAPATVQAKPGATTTTMGKTATPPPHQHPGQPKIAAKPTQVDRATLLPRESAKPAIAGAAKASAPLPGK